LEQVIRGGIATNLRRMIVANMLQIELLFESNLASKFINFGANGVSIFQGVKIGLT
jgi:hypothetical protein